MPRWYPVSISGYHIGEAGATPVQQAAYTLSNGFAYVEMLRDRGMDVNEFGPRLSFFLDCGLDVEYLALTRVCRKIWAIGMRDVFGAGSKAQTFKVHTQTSGRSLIANEFKNNLTRTAIELMLAYINGTNSCHSNSADEPFTTPERRIRAPGRARRRRSFWKNPGLFKHTMNLLSGSPGMKAVEQAVEEAILDEFRADRSARRRAGGDGIPLPAQPDPAAAHRYEQQIYDGTRPIIALEQVSEREGNAAGDRTRSDAAGKKQFQVDRLNQFKKKNAAKAAKALASSGGGGDERRIVSLRTGSRGSLFVRPDQRLPGRFRPMV